MKQKLAFYIFPQTIIQAFKKEIPNDTIYFFLISDNFTGLDNPQTISSPLYVQALTLGFTNRFV